MIQLAGIALGAAMAAGGLVVPEAASDEAAAVAAIDAFTARMLDAGFVVSDADDADDADDDDDDTGDLGDSSSDPDDSDAEDGTDNDGDSDDPIDECFAAAGIDVPDDPDAPMPGTTAEAESPELEFVVEEPATTEVFDLTPTIPESITAMVTTVGESGVELMTQLVDWMGSKAAAECFEQSILGDMFETEGDDDTDIDMPAPEIEMSNSGDIGVGDHSARLDMSISFNFLVQIDVDMTMLMAQSDRSMAMVMHVTGADGAPSGVDPIAELQMIVDDLAA